MASAFAGSSGPSALVFGPPVLSRCSSNMQNVFFLAGELGKSMQRSLFQRNSLATET